MKRALSILFILFFLGGSRAWAADRGESRMVTISTLCLLDEESHRTRETVAGAVEQATRRGRHDLIVAPLTPFLSFREGREAEDLGDFAALARTGRTYLAVAMMEVGGDGRRFCTSILFGREGQVAGKYRKTHALPDDDFSLGDELPVFRTDFGTLGMSLGTDFYFPEVYAVERMKGADILVWQHAPERFREHFQWVPLLLARALDSHAHLVTATYADPRCYITNRYEMGMQGAAWGRSMILNRVGTPVADTGYEDGIATAILDLAKRKADPYGPLYEGENVFFVNCLGDRAAFRPLAEPWKPPALPAFARRKARIAVGTFWDRDMWRNDRIPDAMFRVLDEAAKVHPDLVLLSEMGARIENETVRKVAGMVGERARAMNAYVLVGGVGDTSFVSIARLWNRAGEMAFEEPIYWTRGFPEIKVLDTDFARIGVHTCGDLYTGEVDRTLAVLGAELILDPSQMWGPDGATNETLLRARAIDNGCWIACARWNSSDPGLRSQIVDPYGAVLSASPFQQEGVIFADIDFDRGKVYYAGNKPQQPKRGDKGIPTYFTEDLPEQRPGWREMIFSRRRPELYGILPTTNEVIMKDRPVKGPWE